MENKNNKKNDKIIEKIIGFSMLICLGIAFAYNVVEAQKEFHVNPIMAVIIVIVILILIVKFVNG
jgi:hypothetical protein